MPDFPPYESADAGEDTTATAKVPPHESANATEQEIASAIFSTYFDKLRRYFARSSRSPEDAEDLAQEVLVRALRTKIRMENRAELEGYLFGIARNTLFNSMRSSTSLKRSGQTLSLDDSSLANSAGDIPDLTKDPLSIMLRSEDERILMEAILELPDRMRMAMRLRIAGYSYRDMAGMMKVSIDTIKSLVYQAKRRISQSVSPGIPSEDD